MAGASIGTWVKVKTKAGLTPRVIPNKYGGGEYQQGQTITQAQFNEVQKARQSDNRAVSLASVKTDLASPLSLQGRGDMSKRQAKTFVTKANKHFEGRVREYRKNQTVVLADGSIHAWSGSSDNWYKVG